jgi:hypothetical protein
MTRPVASAAHTRPTVLGTERRLQVVYTGQSVKRFEDPRLLTGQGHRLSDGGAGEKRGFGFPLPCTTTRIPTITHRRAEGTWEACLQSMRALSMAPEG